MAATRGLVRLAVPAAVALLGGCTTLGPDFQAPQVPWLQGWSGGAWRTLADEAPRSAQPRDDEWWRQFDDAVLDRLVAEAQRLNPGVRTAGLRILEARAQLGIAGSALYPQLQQVNAEALRVGNRGSDGRGTAFWSAGLAFDLAWELDFWGKFKRGIESALRSDHRHRAFPAFGRTSHEPVAVQHRSPRLLGHGQRLVASWRGVSALPHASPSHIGPGPRTDPRELAQPDLNGSTSRSCSARC
jgi:hypothetical protein